MLISQKIVIHELSILSSSEPARADDLYVSRVNLTLYLCLTTTVLIKFEPRKMLMEYGSRQYETYSAYFCRHLLKSKHNAKYPVRKIHVSSLFRFKKNYFNILKRQFRDLIVRKNLKPSYGQDKLAPGTEASSEISQSPSD